MHVGASQEGSENSKEVLPPRKGSHTILTKGETRGEETGIGSRVGLGLVMRGKVPRKCMVNRSCLLMLRMLSPGDTCTGGDCLYHGSRGPCS